MLVNIEGKRRREQQRMKWLDVITNSLDMSLNKLREVVEDRGAWRAAVRGIAKVWTWPRDWTTTIIFIVIASLFDMNHELEFREICLSQKYVKTLWLALDVGNKNQLLASLVHSIPKLVITKCACVCTFSVAKLCLTLLRPQEL